MKKTLKLLADSVELERDRLAVHSSFGSYLNSIAIFDLFCRFTWRMKLLTGRRGIAILYAYMLAGLGFLRLVSPDFGDLTSREQQLEGSFRQLKLYVGH